MSALDTAGNLPTRSLPHQSDCSFVQANAAGHALSALDLEEGARIDRHVISCPACARVLAEMRRAIEFLPFAVTAAEPPARAKTALMERVAASSPASRQLPVDATGRTLTIPASSAIAEPPIGGTARGVSPARKGRNWGAFTAPLAAVPLILLVVLVGGYAFNLRSDKQNLSEQVALLSTGAAASDLSKRVDLHAPNSPAGASATDGPRGYVFMASGSNRLLLFVTGLNPGSQYRIVAEGVDGKPIPCDEVVIDESGSGVEMIALGQPVETVRMLHVQPMDASGSVADAGTSGDVLMADMSAAVETE